MSRDCVSSRSSFFFFFNDTATTEIYTLSLHDALPIYPDAAPCPNNPGAPRICVDVELRNAGKTPPIGSRTHRLITFGPDAERTIKAMKVPVYDNPSGEISEAG